MDCHKIKENIVEYFIDPNFDWKTKYFIDEHILRCAECENLYILTETLLNKHVMSEPIKNTVGYLLSERSKKLLKSGKYNHAKALLNEALNIKPSDTQTTLLIQKGYIEIEKLIHKDRFKKIREKIISLSSKISLTTTINKGHLSPLHVGASSATDLFHILHIEDTIKVIVKSPSNLKGYIIIFDISNDDSCKIVFPKKINQSNTLKANKSKTVELIANKPAGIHFFKTIWTEKNHLTYRDAKKFNEGNFEYAADQLEKYMSEFKSGKWYQATIEIKILPNA